MVILTNPKEIKEAVNILKDEINQQTYEQIRDERPTWASINLFLDNGKESDDGTYMGFKKSYTQFEEWLNQNLSCKEI